MNKEFIPYEQALALKELGFDEPCFGFYTYEGKFSNELSFNEYKNTALKTSAPLYQQAFRFFSEKYDLEGVVQNAEERAWCKFHIYELFKDCKIMISAKLEMTREEAELACLKKLIEIVRA
jgi:hypothetical protein